MTSSHHKEMGSVIERGRTDEEQLELPASAVAGDAPPSSVLIAPWGRVDSANGTFEVDEESAELAIAAFEAHGTDLPIDYEHQSLGGRYASPTGQAPAAGWIRSLRLVRPGDEAGIAAGLYAEVEWTDSAREKLVAKEYRYLSPVVVVRKSDRRMVALHSAALTNKPAIPGMRPIVNSAGSTSGAESLPADLCPGDAVELLRMRLGLPQSSDAQAVLAAAEQRLGSLMHDVARRDAEQRVKSAIQAGKLAPAQHDWAMNLAMKDPAAFDEWAACAPAVVMLGRTEPPADDARISGSRDRAAAIASARASFRQEPALALLTSESAWIRDSLREQGFETLPHDEGDDIR